ncbi:hypothetical protein CPB86DRAFT_532047 [Serendipita vermifera]|nr:hypothetical protein CPB86DRAFT_532047 [Serendipita vermifera]
MLPTTAPAKKPYLFTTSLYQNENQAQPDNVEETTSPSLQASRRNYMIRDALVLLVCIILSVAFIVWGPSGDFIAGRAFTVSTSNEVTYIFYNWTVQIPMDSLTLNMQARNNRLVGDITFKTTSVLTTHYTVNIETTAPASMFKMTTMSTAQQCGFSIVVDDRLPNVYGIDYANVVVYLPAQKHYKSLIWNTYPPNEDSPASLEGRKWNIHFENLTHAEIAFDKVRVETDRGVINSKGIRSTEGYFETMKGGKITGEYTVPKANLTFNDNGGY